jgi:hypothetical protein
MDIIAKIDSIDAEKIKTAFKELMKDYLTPAFGAISKRDFDILLFMKFQELGLFENNPEIYDIVSSLKVTRTKARNLLYEAKLRDTSQTDLDKELILLLQSPIFLKDNDKIALEIGNPFLTDHLRAKLKKLGHITDGSFSSELIKLTEKAYLSLFEDMLPDGKKDEIKKALIESGIATDTSFKGVMKGVLKKLGKKFAGDVGDEIAENVGEYLAPIITGGIELIKGKISTLTTEETETNDEE